MKKIGILTHYCNSKNIGGLLQAYAMVNFLSVKGFVVEQISFPFNYEQLHKLVYPRTITFKKIIKFPFNRTKGLYRSLLNKQISPKIVVQNKFFSEFENFISHSNVIYNNTNIIQANKDYEIFITGSDQVFASYLLPLSSYYGEFTTPNKNVLSYAASSDVKQMPNQYEQVFIQKLSHLNAISVREKTLKEYIERITPYKATVVLDPTFLLSPQEWLQIANPAPVPKNPYIFCYFLGGKSAWQRKIAQSYADKYGYEVVHLPYIMGTLRLADQFLKGQGRYDVGPREFIALINGAQCVFTDSFHGLAFSINFGKNFYVFNRDDQSGPQSMNARITDTLATFGLTARHITDKNAVLDNIPLDFTHAHQVLAREKELSINWLLSALK